MKNNLRSNTRWEELNRLFEIGVAVVISIDSFSFAKEKLILLFSMESFKYFPLLQLSIILFVLTLTLIFRWIFSVLTELRILREYFGDFKPPPFPSSTYPTVILLAIVFGILIHFYDNIAVFSGIFLCLNILDIWGQKIRNESLKRLICEANSKNTSENNQKEARDAIETYYLKKPQITRVIITAFFTLVALILSLLANFLTGSHMGKILIYFAYCIMIINIIFSGIVITLWRSQRDKVIMKNMVDNI
ncbi:MAG: hypothetical protein ACRENZ_06785 [Thermodesulfobacteriota bacterium]